jgi:6-phosphogluconolactonase (cycloisomerase 2 family)
MRAALNVPQTPSQAQPAKAQSGASSKPGTVNPAATSETFVYIADFQPGGIAQFRIGKDGGLTPLSPARARVGKGATRIVVDKAGRFAYVQNKEGIISHCQINGNETLSAQLVADIPTANKKS